MGRVIPAQGEIELLEDEQLSGRRLGNYRLERLLGHGNRSSVYQAKDITSWEPVAVRVLDADLSADRAFVARFDQSIARVTESQHRYLLPILDHGTEEGLVYVVRPFITGATLRDHLGAPLAPDGALRLFQPIAEALDYAHERGLVHGDLKPGNILLTTPEQPLIADFGLAQALPQGNSFIATGRGEHLGTPEYVSPEQGCGAAFDKRADLYALGVMLYEASTGRPPFRVESAEDTARTIVMAHVTTPPPSPRGVVPALSPAVESVLLRALAKRPQERYASAGALCAALADAAGLPFTTSAPPLAASGSVGDRETMGDGDYVAHRPLRPRRNWWYVGLALLVLVGFLAFAGLLIAR